MSEVDIVLLFRSISSIFVNMTQHWDHFLKCEERIVGIYRETRPDYLAVTMAVCRYCSPNHIYGKRITVSTGSAILRIIDMADADKIAEIQDSVKEGMDKQKRHRIREEINTRLNTMIGSDPDDRGRLIFNILAPSRIKKVQPASEVPASVPTASEAPVLLGSPLESVMVSFVYS